ncbi:MAG TPA: kelch repeat-containing protein [Candidatus Eremiobacteraceae bacterium]
MPTARSSIAGGVVNRIFYAVGGLNTIQSNTAYDPATSIWTVKVPLSTPRLGLAMGVINGILYAVGGCCDINGQSLNTVEAHDPASPATDTWITKASMPTARFGLAAGVVKGILYAVGGANDINGGGTLNTVEAYDSATNTWTTKASMPTARSGLAVGVINGILYAVGGCDNNTTQPHNFNTVEAYNPTTNTWTTKTSMPTARQYPAVGIINGILYAIGGLNVYDLNTVEAYNPATDAWTTKASMPTARDGLAVGVIGRRLYAAGGWNGGSLKTFEVFDPR